MKRVYIYNYICEVSTNIIYIYIYIHISIKYVCINFHDELIPLDESSAIQARDPQGFAARKACASKVGTIFMGKPRENRKPIGKTMRKPSKNWKIMGKPQENHRKIGFKMVKFQILMELNEM